MQINNEEMRELSEIQRKVLQHDIAIEIFDSDIQRRKLLGNPFIVEKYNQCLKRLKNEWIPKLTARSIGLPTKEDDLLKLIFLQPDYKNRSERDSFPHGRIK